MLKKTFFIAVQMFAAAAVAACGGSAVSDDETLAANSSKELQAERHCLVHMTPGDAAGAPMKLGPMTCYSTISEVISAATHGRVVLPAATKGRDINEQMLRAAGYDERTAAATGGYLVGMDYTETNLAGSSLTFTATYPCYDRFTGTYYSVSTSSMPAGWDNVVSSVETFQYCHSTTLYDYINFGGNAMTTGCQSPLLSSMDNRTSSQSWSYNSYGYACWF